jgi:hypothetical protein
LRHCTTSWVFSFNARSAGIEVTPTVVITRRDALAEALYWPAGSNGASEA